MAEISLDLQDYGVIGIETVADGKVHRRLIEPGRWEGGNFVPNDLKGETPKTIELAAKVWTPEIIAAWAAWLEEVNKPEPYRTPDRVTARQFKLQLLADNLLDHVESWVAAQGKAIQLAYDNSGTFARDEPMMQAGFKALGFPPERIDAFFSAASKR